MEAEILRVMPRYRWTADDAVAAALEQGANLKGKHVIVTGATSGIAIPTVLALAKTGCHLTVTARDPSKAKDLAERYTQAAAAAGGTLRFADLDLCCYASVDAFVRAWGTQPIEVLLHNAGVMATPHTLTADGEEIQFQVNLLSVVKLTDALAPLVQGRVVIVSSIAHKRLTTITDIAESLTHFGLDVKDPTKYNKWHQYMFAKSCAIMYANQLNAEFVARGSPARALSLHPGGILTGLQSSLSKEEMTAMGWFNADGEVNPAFKNVEQGAATSVWAATSPELNGVGGVYCENCAITTLESPVPEDPKLAVACGTAPHVWRADWCAQVADFARSRIAAAA